MHCEVRTHVAAMKSGDRLAFINTHLGEVAEAVLTAPAFLSGLSSAELNIVRQRVQARANPTIADAKAATIKALEQCEGGWRNAANQIRTRGGLEKSVVDGSAEKVAQRAGTSVWCLTGAPQGPRSFRPARLKTGAAGAKGFGRSFALAPDIALALRGMSALPLVADMPLAVQKSPLCANSGHSLIRSIVSIR